jgi:predicted nuclease with TOPRIM domain
MAEVQEKKKGGSKKALILAFIIILLAINAVQVWMNINNSKELDKSNKTIVNQQTKIDSISVQLDEAIKDLESKKQQIAQLGGDTTKFGEQIRALAVERDKYKKEAKNNYTKFDNLQKRLDEANKLRSEAEAEVIKYKKLLAMADTENTKLKYQINEKLDTINNLKLSKRELAQKVALASVLKAQNIKIDAINVKGKEKEGGEYRAKNLDKIRITFTLGENKVATKEGKDVYIRVIEPDGAALFDLATGGGSFMYENKEIFYTMKTNILYTGNDQRVGFEYKKGSPYKPGAHKVEVYCEGNMIGEGSFVVK